MLWLMIGYLPLYRGSTLQILSNDKFCWRASYEKRLPTPVRWL
jgi:hypothetical protein